MDRAVERAAEALRRGDLVVYPTETVYGLGADALDPAAIDRVFAVKNRPRDRPLSIAFPDLASSLNFVHPTPLERSFMERFLPGPITVLVDRGGTLPERLTAGRDRVGVRIPDHELARSLLHQVAPITATSANVSGRPNARRPADLDERIRSGASIVLEGGETPGGESTVVDVTARSIVRRGLQADLVERWLDETGGS